MSLLDILGVSLFAVFLTAVLCMAPDAWRWG